MSIRTATHLFWLCALCSIACSSSGCGGAVDGGRATGATGGNATGGYSATGGYGATGGTGGYAGSGGMSCNGSGTPAASCAPQDPTDPCQICQQQHCCTEWEDCAAENPSDPCAAGGPDGTGELACFQSCYVNEVNLGADDSTARLVCAGQCATPSCGGTTVSWATSSLVACLVDSCLTECLVP